MSVMREELHRLIDRLSEEQVAPTLALVRDSLPAGEDGEPLWPLPSFVGTLASGQGDVAALAGHSARGDGSRRPVIIWDTGSIGGSCPGDADVGGSHPLSAWSSWWTPGEPDTAEPPR